MTSLTLNAWFSACAARDYDTVNKCVQIFARSKDAYHETALMKAVRARDLELVKLLAPHETGITNDKGYTALIIAAINDQPLFCEALYYFEANDALPDGRTALMMAATVNANRAVAYLAPLQARRRDENGLTALMFAAVHSSPKTVQILLAYERGLVCGVNKTALILAAEHYRRDIICQLYPYEHGVVPDAEAIALKPYKDLVERLKGCFANALDQRIGEEPSHISPPESLKTIARALHDLSHDPGNKENDLSSEPERKPESRRSSYQAPTDAAKVLSPRDSRQSQSSSSLEAVQPRRHSSTSRMKPICSVISQDEPLDADSLQAVRESIIVTTEKTNVSQTQTRSLEILLEEKTRNEERLLKLNKEAGLVIEGLQARVRALQDAGTDVNTTGDRKQGRALTYITAQVTSLKSDLASLVEIMRRDAEEGANTDVRLVFLLPCQHLVRDYRKNSASCPQCGEAVKSAYDVLL
ncbi:Ankyrin repeat protein 1 [Giardia muris]|uniref:Ankyrin repeat protein 1 n=1 Tax=Giardia muris TaxID=5742 RepID=A0A4Z1SQW6_GIAMU|nr:Ankyrin repeat protein 1 [Giardia muris]|eukprot:TNJ28090.1 Ankyrin repeat protein 1 [Giardia muris]